jgi:hypothetical protein
MKNDAHQARGGSATVLLYRWKKKKKLKMHPDLHNPMPPQVWPCARLLLSNAHRTGVDYRSRFCARYSQQFAVAPPMKKKNYFYYHSFC